MDTAYQQGRFNPMMIPQSAQFQLISNILKECVYNAQSDAFLVRTVILASRADLNFSICHKLLNAVNSVVMEKDSYYNVMMEIMRTAMAVLETAKFKMVTFAMEEIQIDQTVVNLTVQEKSPLSKLDK